MTRVLIVAYYFPPIGGIGSIRMARFAEHLPQLGWEPTVLAPRDTPHPQDDALHVREDRVIRSRSLELSRLGRAVPGRRTTSNGAGPGSRAGGLRQAIRRGAHRYVFYPDGQIGWYPGAVRAGRRALSAGGFDAIYSSSNPITAHLVARTLHRQSGLPWVAEFRDPWSDRLGRDHPYAAHAERLSRRIAGEARRVIVPTPTMASHLSELWERDIDLVMNGHDLESPAPDPPQRPTITHIGTYYPGRQDLRVVWEAIRRHRSAGAGAAPQIRFVGQLPDELARELEQFGLSDLVEVTGLVPHAAAMEAMLSSSLLVASGFTGDDPLSLGVIPAKLFEYLASGLPILYVGKPSDDAWRLLDGEQGCSLVEADDVDGAAAAVAVGLRARAGVRDAGHHSRQARAVELGRVLDEAIRDTAPRN
jgi:glycosyltransferase involved in cell wall biosynthesis